ncbi:hypothetical protein D3C85_428800 [compost metagenome]
MPVGKPSQIVASEGRLLMSDRFQRDARIARNELAVPASDLAVIGRSLGWLASVLSSRACRTDLVLRLQVNSLIFKRAVIDPSVDIQSSEVFVRVLRPCFAPMRKKLYAVPVSDLCPEPLVLRLSHSQHHVSVRLGRTVFGSVPMHIEVGHHAPVDELLLHERSSQLDPIHAAHFTRNGKLHLARKLGVFSLLDGLNFIPKRLAILPALRGLLWSKNL